MISSNGAGARVDQVDQQQRVGQGESAEAEPMPPVEEVAGKLARGEMQPDEVSADQRQHYVHQLVHMGYSSADIARVFGVHVRTIERDRRQLRQRQAVRSKPTLAGEIVGQFQQFVDASSERLTRLANDASVAPQARLQAEELLVRHWARYVQTVHKLGFLPTGGKYGLPAPEELVVDMVVEAGVHDQQRTMRSWQMSPESRRKLYGQPGG